MRRPAGPHVAARMEDRFDQLLGRLMRRQGWSPVVTASTGYADNDGVHVFVRVLLGPPMPGDRAAGHRRRWRWATRRARPPRGWRSLIALPAPGTPVTVTVGERQHTLTAERGGYVHAELPMVLVPGWHEAIVAVDGREPVACRVRAVDPRGERGVISDIDDTIVVTWVPRPLLAAWNTFILREKARRPVPGMGELLRALAGEDGFVFYLSTGAWNFAPHLERFMTEHGLPPGPLLLSDWGPTPSGWFRSGATHKRDMLERLRREHPSARWTLVGDDGQHDPQIYADFAAAHPHAVHAVAIRRLSAAQQVLASGTTSGARTTDPMAPAARAHPLPWVTGSDGYELLAALRGAGALRIIFGLTVNNPRRSGATDGRTE